MFIPRCYFHTLYLKLQYSIGKNKVFWCIPLYTLRPGFGSQNNPLLLLRLRKFKSYKIAVLNYNYIWLKKYIHKTLCSLIFNIYTSYVSFITDKFCSYRIKAQIELQIIFPVNKFFRFSYKFRNINAEAVEMRNDRWSATLRRCERFLRITQTALLATAGRVHKSTDKERWCGFVGNSTIVTRKLVSNVFVNNIRKVLIYLWSELTSIMSY